MEFFEANSRREYADFASAAFAPTEVPASSSWLATCRQLGSCESFRQNVTTSHANRNVRSRMSQGGSFGHRAALVQESRRSPHRPLPYCPFAFSPACSASFCLCLLISLCLCSFAFSSPFAFYLLPFAFCLLPFAFASPIPPHLRHPLHVDRRALALVFARHRLEQIERLFEVVLNRLSRRAEVEPPDLGELVCRSSASAVSSPSPGRHQRRAFRRSEALN